MKSLSNNTNSTKTIGALLALLLLCSTPSSARASMDTFCTDLPGIQENVENKKTTSIDTLRGLQEKHSSLFGGEKIKFTALRSLYEKQKITPEFTASKKRQEVQRARDIETRLGRIEELFQAHKILIDETLMTVESMEKEAFQKAYDACEENKDASLAAQTFKEDMKEIQTFIRERGESFKAKKEVLGSLKVQSKQSTTDPRRGIFFFNSHYSLGSNE